MFEGKKRSELSHVRIISIAIFIVIGGGLIGASGAYAETFAVARMSQVTQQAFTFPTYLMQAYLILAAILQCFLGMRVAKHVDSA